LKIESPLNWSTISETSFIASRSPNRRSYLFAKIEDEEIQKQIDKLEATKTARRDCASKND
jgi:methionyl-tRNA synthetase